METMERRVGEMAKIMEEKLQQAEAHMRDEMRSTAGPARRSTASRGSSATSATSSGTWTRRLLHIRDFAAYGRPARDKLRKQTLEQVQNMLLKSLPAVLSARLIPMQGFALAVSFRVVEADVRQTADAVDNWLVDHKPEIRGRPVRAAPGTSPQRRRGYATFYKLQRQLEGLRKGGP